jgi:Mycothiol maleylpyruvate isomerase N-terminal domain
MAGTADVDLPLARRALTAAAARSAALVTSLPDIQGRLDRSEWTVGEVAAHMVIGLRGFTDAVTNDSKEWRPLIPDTASYRERLTGLNRITIAAEPRRGAPDGGRAITDAAAAFLAATDDLGPSEKIATPWYGDHATHTVLSATCLLVGEQLIHGYDIARSVGRRWPISGDEATVVFEGIRAMLPLVINPASAGNLSASFEVHVGRRSRFVVRVAEGVVDVGPAGESRVDCHIAGTPTALVLVGYRRISQWQAIGTGRLIAWGRKPWLGLRFVNLFHQP